jgi:transposase
MTDEEIEYEYYECPECGHDRELEGRIMICQHCGATEEFTEIEKRFEEEDV